MATPASMTDEEIKQFASNLVSLTLATAIEEHARVNKAIASIDSKAWCATIDQVTEQVAEAIIRRIYP